MRVRLNIFITMLGLTTLSVIGQSATRKQFPSDVALRARFLAHRADFEKLVVMTNEDSHLTRIAPDFTWLDDDAGWPRRNVGISEQRWNDYRQTFRRISTPNGINKYTSPTSVMFPIVSIGLVPTGAAKGIVYSQETLSPVLKSLDKSPPAEFWDGPDHSHVLVYKQLESHWYIYYNQW